MTFDASRPSAPETTRTPSRSGSGRLLNIVLAVAAAVAIGGVTFAIGRSTAPAPATAANGPGRFGNGVPGDSFAPGASGAPGIGQGGFGGGAGGFGGGLSIEGTVESVNGDTLTIMTANGQTIEVSTGAATTYHTEAEASAADVQTGATVKVQLEFGGAAGGARGGGIGRPNASGAPAGPVGTAGDVTVVP